MELNSNKLAARLVAEDLPGDCPPGALLGGLACQDDPVMLDSAALHETFGRYTILTCQPLEVLLLHGPVLSRRDGQVLAEGPEAVWAKLEEAFAAVRLEPAAAPRAEYLPGWYGYVGYEVGRLVERLPGRAVRDTAFPDLRLGFYDAVAVYDAIERRWRLVRLAFGTPPPGAGRAAETLRALIAAGGQGDAHPAPAEHADAKARPMPADARPNFTPEAYRRAVARCAEYIAAGDIFQVNLSQRLTVGDLPAPPAIYRALRRRNPAWYAAYLSFASAGRSCAVLSSSPELFLRVRGDRVLTRPIKGTRPRVGDASVDAAAAADLLASEKDNAELAMIIDLLRNDLGRICRYGSVEVVEARRLETHPTVLHLVGTVVGRLRAGVGPAALIRATFPGGSITGAPKIRAMEIIDELEPGARNVYTGCIGCVGVDRRAEWNIAIRTMICDGPVGHVQVGGGIVADSTPAGEYAETLDKARAMLEAIEQARTESEKLKTKG